MDESVGGPAGRRAGGLAEESKARRTHPVKLSPKLSALARPPSIHGMSYGFASKAVQLIRHALKLERPFLSACPSACLSACPLAFLCLNRMPSAHMVHEDRPKSLRVADDHHHGAAIACRL